MRATLILTAVELEAATLARALELPRLAEGPGVFGRGAVRVAVVGLRARLLAERWPALAAGLDRPLVVSAGVCGALDPSLAPGALVVPGRLVGPDGESPEVSADHHRLAMAVAPSAATGCLATSREVVPTPRDKATLFARTGAVAVDMESSLIAEAAAGAGLPAIAVRGVSDAAHQSLPAELAGLVTAEGRLRIAGAAALLARPRVVPRALELRRATHDALRAVAAVLAGLTAAPVAD